MASDGDVWLWAKDPGPGGCAQLGPLPALGGRVPTLVIVRSAGCCEDSQHPQLGIVFFGPDPVAWGCMSAADESAFMTWAIATFPSARIVPVSSPKPLLNCPPPSGASPVDLTAVRNELKSLAQAWFAQAPVVRSPLRVA